MTMLSKVEYLNSAVDEHKPVHVYPEFHTQQINVYLQNMELLHKNKLYNCLWIALRNCQKIL